MTNNTDVINMFSVLFHNLYVEETKEIAMYVPMVGKAAFSPEWDSCPLLILNLLYSSIENPVLKRRHRMDQSKFSISNPLYEKPYLIKRGLHLYVN